MINTDANAVSYVIVTGTTSGDLLYGADSDTTINETGRENRYWNGCPLNDATRQAGGAVVATSGPVATANTDDFLAIAPPWVGM